MIDSKVSRVSVRQWLSRRRHETLNYTHQLWRKRLQRPARAIVSYAPIWGFVLLAILTYLTVIRGYLPGLNGPKDFHTNLVAEFIGLCVAFALAWFLIERHTHKQSQRISEGVGKQISVIRQEAAWVITTFTTRVYDEPAFHLQLGGPWYVSTHYTGLQELLEKPGPEYMLPTAVFGRNLTYSPERDPNRWLFVRERYKNLSRVIERSIHLFGPGLLEHHRLLITLDELQRRIEMELGRWQLYQEETARQERTRYERLQDLARQRRSSGLEPQEPMQVPPEALLNLLVLTRDTLDVVALITGVLRDWNNIPVPQESLVQRPVWVWPSRASRS